MGVRLQEEVKALSKEDRRVLLQEAALPIVVTTEHALATLSISWNKLRTLRRYVRNRKWNEINITMCFLACNIDG